MNQYQTSLRVFACIGALSASAASAQTTVDTTYNLGQGIPDNNVSGIAITKTFSAPSIAQITGLQVTLDISGGFNGDFYAYLTHGTGFSVLLNRVGRDPGSPLGYPDSGMDVTFSDSAANNIHDYRLTLNPAGGPLTGTWAPDGRNTNPATVTSADPVTADLSSFTGIDPNGDWTLFIADLDSGDVGTLQSLELDVTGLPAPDQTSAGALLAISLTGLCLFRRIRTSSASQI